MKLTKTAEGKEVLQMTRKEWKGIGEKNKWLVAEAKKDKGWPKKLEKGRFTEYCKKQGFDGPCKECANKALKSDDASVRGMASWYLNTVKP